MTKTTNWTDEDWLLLLQLYLRKPVGVKPLYSRAMVDLALELHIPPADLFARMCAVAAPDTPMMERMWQKYAASPRRLARDVALLRGMRGFGRAEEFFSGVAVNETFERCFRPIAGLPGVKPVMLVLVLDLYFRLAPPTMVARTPEVAELSKLMRVDAELVVGAMAVYRHLDPYLNHPAPAPGPLYDACREVWKRYGNADPVRLASYAAQLREYFK